MQASPTDLRNQYIDLHSWGIAEIVAWAIFELLRGKIQLSFIFTEILAFWLIVLKYFKAAFHANLIVILSGQRRYAGCGQCRNQYSNKFLHNDISCPKLTKITSTVANKAHVDCVIKNNLEADSDRPMVVTASPHRSASGKLQG